MEKQYYNAKPSKVSNIGEDLPGAMRMNFDTYETTEEREAKERAKRVKKNTDNLNEKLKTEIFSEAPNTEIIQALLIDMFENKFGFRPNPMGYDVIISEKRSEAIQNKTHSDFNKMLRAYNRLRSDYRDLSSHYRYKYWLASARKKFSPKQSFTEQSGISAPWKKYEENEGEVITSSEFLASNTRGVQFGNSVPDSERNYILVELSSFLKQWYSTFKVPLAPLGWSFGARGKAGSVAYYQPSSKIISVNRHNIGSLVHEVGHYIDHVTSSISRKISYDTVKAYADSLPDYLSPKELRYYCKREEIFARALEAYTIKHSLGFSEFGQCGTFALPELNEELETLIKHALGV